MTLKKTYMKLALAILFEVFATTMLVVSEGFTRIIASFFAIAGYGVCYYILTYVFRRMHIGVVYAIWSGIGIVAVNVIGILIFGNSVTGVSLFGMWLIVTGVVVVNFSTKSKNERNV